MTGLYRTMAAIRYFEEQVKVAFMEGRFGGTVHLSIGQELVDASIIAANPSAMIFGNHRSHGQYIARTGDFEGLVGQIRKGCSQPVMEEPRPKLSITTMTILLLELPTWSFAESFLKNTQTYGTSTLTEVVLTQMVSVLTTSSFQKWLQIVSQK